MMVYLKIILMGALPWRRVFMKGRTVILESLTDYSETGRLLLTPQSVTGRLFFPSRTWKENLHGGQRTCQCEAKSMHTWYFDWWWSPRRHTLLSSSLQRTTWNKKRLRICFLVLWEVVRCSCKMGPGGSRSKICMPQSPWVQSTALVWENCL